MGLTLWVEKCYAESNFSVLNWRGWSDCWNHMETVRIFANMVAYTLRVHVSNILMLFNSCFAFIFVLKNHIFLQNDKDTYILIPYHIFLFPAEFHLKKTTKIQLNTTWKIYSLASTIYTPKIFIKIMEAHFWEKTSVTSPPSSFFSPLKQ